MKNPRIGSAVQQHAGVVQWAPPLEIREGKLVASGGSGGSLTTLDAKAPAPAAEPSDFGKVLKILKFTEAEIKQMVELAATVALVASVVGWVVAAISTAKQIATFLGILSEDDPVIEALKPIGARVESIYAYLSAQDRKGLIVEEINYHTKINTIRNAVSNLALSRSDTALATLANHVNYLQETIEKMLSPQNADIAFLRQVYGYGEKTWPPSHWVDMATPFYMRRSDGTGVDYADPSKDLAATIWDPGHYLDILIPAIAVRLAALEVTEPAFRSTGYDRSNLKDIYNGLDQFIQKWNNSFFVTNIIGPIDPTPEPYTGFHKMAQNPLYDDPSKNLLNYRVEGAPSIALGCIDPVSGIAILDPAYADGFAVHLETRYANNPTIFTKYWVLSNYDQSIAKAYARQAEMMTELRARCGIKRFYELKDSVARLIHLNESEFVDLSAAKFETDGLHLVNADEKIDLGIIGNFAGLGGKKYSSKRYHQKVTKQFRIPMARRTDATRIQLGYRMEVSVGSHAATANLVLCPFSRLNSPLQAADYFPSAALSATIAATDAKIYDIIESEGFSAADEDIFEESGAVAGKRRLFVNPRMGSASLEIAVTFHFDIAASDSPFIGFADVEISTVSPDANADGFIANVIVFETLPPFDPTTNNPPVEWVADSMNLHFTPSYLIAPPDYFTDRDAGFEALGRIVGRINDRFSEVAHVGLFDPIERIARHAQIEAGIKRLAETQLREHPEQMRVIFNRLKVKENDVVHRPS